MSNVAIIPARAGSKGIINKNIALLCGKPLIQYSIEIALHSPSIDYVLVTSDSQNILDIAKNFGKRVITILRPANLATDDSGSAGVVEHAADHLSGMGIYIEFIVLLQPTSPYRKVEFIEESIALIKSSNKESLFSVSSPIQHPSDFIFNNDGKLDYIFRSIDATRRQDFTHAKFINGSIYITKYDFFLKTGKIYSLNNCLTYEMPVKFSIDIDTPLDLMICEAIMKDAKG
jgi:CMP-N,N'-diacetyllegionaminic acid synthase